MSNMITINAVAGAIIKFTNVFGTDEAKKNEAADLLRLPVDDDYVLNTGLATIGDPHIDEIMAGQKMGAGNPGLKKDENPWMPEHIVAIRLFHTNSYVYLLPGDVLKITASCAEAAVYYAMIHDDNLKVEFEDPAVIEEGDPREEIEFEHMYLGRTTGIGDFDNGDETDGLYPFQFDTAKATEDAQKDEEEEEGGEEGGGDDPEPEPEPTPDDDIPSGAGVDEGEH